MQTREITLIQSCINNGRIYFPVADVKFFPPQSMGDREGIGHKGQPVTFFAGDIQISSDIRISSSVRISPRTTFAPYLKSVNAKCGDKLRVTRMSDCEYRIDHLPT